MANSYPVVPKNVQGRYYVDESCIYCELCVVTAPDNFAFDNELGFAYIKKQPDCDAEHKLLAEMIDGCPIESIGDRLIRHDEVIDDVGLGSGTTPKSMMGGLAQIVARWFRKPFVGHSMPVGQD